MNRNFIGDHFPFLEPLKRPFPLWIATLRSYISTQGTLEVLRSKMTIVSSC